jgi:membrane protein DedA with SNARE-associated domain
MFDWLVATFSSHPYIGVSLVFLACGLGLPLPEEIVLLFAGFVCHRGLADPQTMMAVCAGAILLGDVIPFALGRTYGPRLLRIRVMRLLITPERLARFDRWFRRRGELVVLISRFIAGIRMVSFFTAGTMRMSWTKFLGLDLAGILPIAIGLVWVGSHYGETIEAVIGRVQQVERGILIAAVSSAAVIGVWYWLRWRRRQQLLVGGPAETYVEPSAPVRREATRGDAEPADPDAEPSAGEAADAGGGEPGEPGEPGGAAEPDPGSGAEPRDADRPAEAGDDRDSAGNGASG